MKPRQAHAHMKAAYVYASLSYHERRRVGCVIVKNDTIIAIGYNGTPSGEDNCCEDEHGKTLPSVIHAEDNAIRKLDPDTDLIGAIMFVTTAPCDRCCELILDAGIGHVIYDDLYRCAEYVQYLRDKGVCVEQLTPQ